MGSATSSNWAATFWRGKPNRAELEGSLRWPVLLYQEAVHLNEDSQTDYRFKTMTGLGAPTPRGGEPFVLVVRKAKDNAFQRGITVGRTSNNDLVIDDPSVSRFHAWFQQHEETGAWSLADAGSKNGSQLSGNRLKPKRPTALPAEARLQFGKVDVTFLIPSAFLDLLQSHASGR